MEVKPHISLTPKPAASGPHPPPPGTHWTGDCVGLTVGLHRVENISAQAGNRTQSAYELCANCILCYIAHFNFNDTGLWSVSTIKIPPIA